MNKETNQPHAQRKRLANARRIVVKIGSSVLIDADHRLSDSRIKRLVDELAVIAGKGVQIILVSSGAVAAGAPIMGLAGRARSIPQKQACAAVGQIRLMSLYESYFSQHGLHVAQLLLTGDGVRDRQRYLNAQNALETLLTTGIVPIINENDTVVVDGIKFGDNDNLSAQVAALANADLLILLSTVDGLYEKHPEDLAENEKAISLVERIDDQLKGYAQDRLSTASINTGGMKSKLLAIEKATHYGIPTVLANGLVENNLVRALAGEEVGTLFLPVKDRPSARKHWILHTLEAKGTLSVDEGAARAILKKGGSLLAIGVTEFEGRFERGDCVSIRSAEGKEIARGLVGYGSQELDLIRGCKSEEFESRLGYRYDDEVVHRDNLALTHSETTTTNS